MVKCSNYKGFPDRLEVVRTIELMLTNRKCFVQDVRFVFLLEAYV